MKRNEKTRPGFRGRKLAGLLLAAALCALSSAGCAEMGMPEQTNKSLTISIPPYMSYQLRGAVAMYRGKYPDVELIVEDHSLDTAVDTQQAYFEGMRAALMSGAGPDLVYDSNGSLFADVRKTVAAGTFAPLDELMKNDPEYAAADYNQTVLEAGRYNGRQYLIPTHYRLPLLLTSREALGAAGAAEEKCGDYFGLMEQLDGVVARGGPQAVGGGLLNPAEPLGIPILDYPNQKVLADDPLLQRAVDLFGPICEQQMASQPFVTMNYDGAKAVLRRQALTISYENSGSALMENAALINGEETPLLLPIRDARGGLQAVAALCVGVRNNSPNQQNAWNFIKILLSEEVQYYRDSLHLIPVREGGPQAVCDEAAQQYKNGGFADEGLSYGALPEEFYAEYRSLTDEITKASLPDSSYFFYRFDDYYAGEKSYEECLSAAKDDLQIWISE